MPAPPMNLGPGLARFAGFGQQSAVPAAPTNPQSAPGQNLTALPDITSLLQSLNQLNIGAQGQANLARIPGEPGLEAASSANIGAELAGQLPQSVLSLLAQQGAERGVATGSPGSPNSNAAYLQALGLTGLQEEQQGQRDLSAAVGRNPVAQLIDPTGQLLTPYQGGSLANEAARTQLYWLQQLQRNPLLTFDGNVGGQLQTPPRTAQQPDLSFFQSLFPGGTLTGGGGAPGATTPDVSTLLGPLSPNYNPAPDNTVTTDQSSFYDPYSQFTDTSFLDSGFDPSLYDTGGG